ncbi:hypothetical protein EZJ19_09170 [Parasulfuritortus cantonensis]|uniref:Uncharacterized protein n=1 Tax=Parasulfuritortus cantonensis TaxID=2528202 RepID=A0A4V2NVT5_9PROT|nr:CDP-glycerol glycerophosphotransferase family protein [Parasulfuritortus cantonensis]TCJ14742.1 hypothetical protein EZJ19_09170 [Parasulfuritortus cantonensis]
MHIGYLSISSGFGAAVQEADAPLDKGSSLLDWGPTVNVRTLLSSTAHLLYLCGCLVPKSKDVWVFGAWMGVRFTDNPMRLFLYAQAAGEKKCVWVAWSPALVRRLRRQGYEACYCASLQGLWWQMRAGKVFFTHDIDKDMLGPAISGRTQRYQLWHGTPLKKIRYGVKAGDRKVGVSTGRRLLHVLFPWKSDTGYDFVPAASDASIDHLKEAFRTEHVVVTGYPRNDVLVPGDIADSRPPVTRCIYMPTFRGEFQTTESSVWTGRFLSETGFDVERLDREFLAMGITMTLRLHPTNMPDPGMIERILHSRTINFDTTEDIYGLLNTYDLLITDYSSIFFDFAITGKPIIHAPFDLEDYKRRNRDLYFEYEEISLTPAVRSWDDVIQLIREFREQGASPDYIARYRALANRFNRYIDNESSRRVYEWACGHVR